MDYEINELGVVDTQEAGEATERARLQRPSLQITVWKPQREFKADEGSMFKTHESKPRDCASCKSSPSPDCQGIWYGLLQ